MKMKLTTHFLNEPESPGSAPYCFSCPSGEFVTVWEAAKLAMDAANAPDMMAHSFFITNEDDKELARWERAGSTWRRVDA